MSITHIYNGISGDLNFNFTTQIISCEDTIETLTIQDLVDGCREAEYSSEGIVFPKICNASGKDYLDVDNGVQVGITLVLLDGWVIYTERDSGVFKVTGGNLVQVSGGDPFEPNPLVTYVNIQSAASTVVSVSSGSGLSTAEHNKLMGLPDVTLTEEQDERLQTIESQTEGSLSEERFKDLTFNKSNTIEGIEASKRITSYDSGTVAGGGIITTEVTYDTDDEYALPSSESVVP